MPTCILHVGMPKTGTSSIQASLYFGLEDPRFRLVNLGHPNGSLFIEPIFRDRPEEFWLHRAKGLSPERLRRMRPRLEARLRGSLRHVRDASATAIISAESLWWQSRGELERLRDFLASEGFEARVLAYVRPHRSFLESSFQQTLRFDGKAIRPARHAGGRWDLPVPDLKVRLGQLESAFGRDRITVRAFRRSSLEGGCVVRDFCRTLGIDLASASIERVNESLSGDAVRMLHCYNRFVRHERPASFHAILMLLDTIAALKSDPLRLHPDVMAPIAGAIDRQDREILDRFGVDLREEGRDDVDRRVRDESDLFRIAPSSVAWLAEATGLAPITAPEGEPMAREVARQVATLARRPSILARIGRLRIGTRRSLRWLRRGDRASYRRGRRQPRIA